MLPTSQCLQWIFISIVLYRWPSHLTAPISSSNWTDVCSVRMGKWQKGRMNLHFHCRMERHPHVNVTIYDIPVIVRKSLPQVSTLENIIAGFKMHRHLALHLISLVKITLPWALSLTGQSQQLPHFPLLTCLCYAGPSMPMEPMEPLCLHANRWSLHADIRSLCGDCLCLLADCYSPCVPTSGASMPTPGLSSFSPAQVKPFPKAGPRKLVAKVKGG